MSQELSMSPSERLISLMDHLGLGAAYFGTPIPRDISDLAAEHPERLAGVVLCVPSRLDPAPFAGIADRVLMIAGERGPAADSTARAVARLPIAERFVLSGYDAPGSWTDAVADRTDEIAGQIGGFLDRLAANGRSAGTLSWGGIYNSYFWLDPARRLTGVIMTQILPFADAHALALYGAFERGVYQAAAA